MTDRNQKSYELSKPEIDFDVMERNIYVIVHAHMCSKDDFLDKDN